MTILYGITLFLFFALTFWLLSRSLELDSKRDKAVVFATLCVLHLGFSILIDRLNLNLKNKELLSILLVLIPQLIIIILSAIIYRLTLVNKKHVILDSIVFNITFRLLFKLVVSARGNLYQESFTFVILVIISLFLSAFLIGIRSKLDYIKLTIVSIVTKTLLPFITMSSFNYVIDTFYKEQVSSWGLFENVIKVRYQIIILLISGIIIEGLLLSKLLSISKIRSWLWALINNALYGIMILMFLGNRYGSIYRNTRSIVRIMIPLSIFVPIAALLGIAYVLGIKAGRKLKLFIATNMFVKPIAYILGTIVALVIVELHYTRDYPGRFVLMGIFGICYFVLFFLCESLIYNKIKFQLGVNPWLLSLVTNLGFVVLWWLLISSTLSYRIYYSTLRYAFLHVVYCMRSIIKG